MDVHVDVHHAELKAFLARRGVRIAQQAADKVANYAKVLAPVDTGRLRGSIVTRVEARGLKAVGTVEAKAKYAVWVHEGTGLYGPRHAYIRPKRGKYLVFRPKGSSRVVFARRVAGMKPRPFLTEALKRSLSDGWTVRVHTPS